jgi:hypothetical protein
MTAVEVSPEPTQGRDRGDRGHVVNLCVIAKGDAVIFTFCPLYRGV